MSYTTVRLMQERRQELAYQFELEAIRLGFTVVKRLPNYRYVLQDQQDRADYRAVILPTSFDFYETRLNCSKGQRAFDLLIVERHNAVVPLRVLSLSQVTCYAPLHVPDLGPRGAKPHTHEEKCLLLSKLLLNFESARDELAAMTPRSRQRYARLTATYLQPHVGRPWAS